METTRTSSIERSGMSGCLKRCPVLSSTGCDFRDLQVEVEVEVEGGGGCGGGGGGGGCAGPPVPVQWWWRVRGNQARRCLGSICTGQSVSQSVRNQL